MKKLFMWAASVVLLVGVVAEADTLFSGLTAGAAVSGTDIFACYQGANPVKSCTAAALQTFLFGQSHTGGNLGGTIGAPTIPAGTITNAMQANEAAHTIRGNNTASAAAPSDLTDAQVAAELPAFTGDAGAGGVKGSVPAPAAGDAAANKVLGAGGGWVAQTGGGGSVSVTASTPNIVINPSPGTGTFTVGTTQPLHDISGAGTAIVAGDAGKTDLLGAFTYTLAQAGSTGFSSQWGTCLLNVGAGNATINATTSTFKGAGGSTSLVLVPGAWACPTSDGTNYQTVEGNNIVAGTNVTVTRNADGTITVASTGGGGITCPTGYTATLGDCTKTLSASASANLTFPVPSTYTNITLTCSNILNSANVVDYIQFDEGAGLLAGTNYTWQGVYGLVSSGASTAQAESASATKGMRVAYNDATGATHFTVKLRGLASGSKHNLTSLETRMGSATSSQGTETYSGFYSPDTTVVVNFALIPDSGTLTSGTCTARLDPT